MEESVHLKQHRHNLSSHTHTHTNYTRSPGRRRNLPPIRTLNLMRTHTHTLHALTRKEGEWLCVCVLVRKRVVGLCVVFDGVCWQACAQHATYSCVKSTVH